MLSSTFLHGIVHYSSSIFFAFRPYACRGSVLLLHFMIAFGNKRLRSKVTSCPSAAYPATLAPYWIHAFWNKHLCNTGDELRLKHCDASNRDLWEGSSTVTRLGVPNFACVRYELWLCNTGDELPLKHRNASIRGSLDGSGTVTRLGVPYSECVMNDGCAIQVTSCA